MSATFGLFYSCHTKINVGYYFLVGSGGFRHLKLQCKLDIYSSKVCVSGRVLFLVSFESVNVSELIMVI